MTSHLDQQFQHIDPAVRVSVLEQCMHEYNDDEMLALAKAKEILTEIGNISLCHAAVLQMQVRDASKRYPLLPEQLLEEICRAYDAAQVEEVLREAHEHLKAERTGAAQTQPSTQQATRTSHTPPNEWCSRISAKTRIVVKHIQQQFPEVSFDFVHDMLQANNGNAQTTIAQMQQLDLQHTPVQQTIPAHTMTRHTMTRHTVAQGDQLARMRTKATELRAQITILNTSIRQLQQSASLDTCKAVRAERDTLLQQVEALELYIRTHTLEHNITVELHGSSADTAAQRVQGTTRLRIITGKGTRSHNGAVLLPLVRHMLTTQGISYTLTPTGGEVIACVQAAPPLHLLQ